MNLNCVLPLFCLFLFVLLASAHFEDLCRPCTGMPASVLHVTVFSVHFLIFKCSLPFSSFSFVLSSTRTKQHSTSSSSTLPDFSAVARASGSAVSLLDQKTRPLLFFAYVIAANQFIICCCCCCCHCCHFSHIHLPLLFLHTHLFYALSFFLFSLLLQLLLSSLLLQRV